MVQKNPSKVDKPVKRAIYSFWLILRKPNKQTDIFKNGVAYAEKKRSS